MDACFGIWRKETVPWLFGAVVLRRAWPRSRQEFGASLPVDKHLYKQDIAGSKAHAKMLAAQGIISAEDEQAIAKGLTGIEQDIDAGNFTFDINDEDIHMSIESELTRRIGEAGKRLHTGRSRNDQVATDTRLGVKALAKELMEANLELRHVLVDAAKKYDKVILPGYTHMQHAQPVLLSHHLLACIPGCSRATLRV